MSRYLRDASDQTAEANAAALSERMDHNEWPDDDRPTRRECDSDEYEAWWRHE